MSKKIGHIYLLQREVEFGTNNYKIGRAADIFRRRKTEASYRNCILHFVKLVSDMYEAENIVIKSFRKKYPYKDDGREHGEEDFTGLLEDMLEDIWKICSMFPVTGIVENIEKEPVRNIVAASCMNVNGESVKYGIMECDGNRFLIDSDMEDIEMDCEKIYKYLDLKKLIKCIKLDAYENGSIVLYNKHVSFIGDVKDIWECNNSKTWWSSVTGIHVDNILCDVDRLNKNIGLIMEDFFKEISIREEIYNKIILRPRNNSTLLKPIILQRNVVTVMDNCEEISIMREISKNIKWVL